MSAIFIKSRMLFISLYTFLIHLYFFHPGYSQSLNPLPMKNVDLNLFKAQEVLNKAVNNKQPGACTVCRQLTKSFKTVSHFKAFNFKFKSSEINLSI